MESYFYLAAIILSFACILIIDFRYKLAFFKSSKATILTVGAATGLFLAWDVMGIGLGIFFEGNSRFTTGLMLANHLPIEELFFLFFFNYLTLMLYRGLNR